MLKNINCHHAEKIGKEFHELFNKHKWSLEIECDLWTVSYLDLPTILQTSWRGTFYPRKIQSPYEYFQTTVRSSHSEVFLKKRCSENMQQIYRRTSMLKCDFIKVVKQLYWNRTSARVLSCKFAAYFQNTFF